jgi:hypothetical protein
MIDMILMIVGQGSIILPKKEYKATGVKIISIILVIPNHHQ